MKYNSVKNKAFEMWKKMDKTPQWAKINKSARCYDAEYYELLTNLQRTLKFLGYDSDKTNLENIGNYLYEIRKCIKNQRIEIKVNSIQNTYRSLYGLPDYWRTFLDGTGYDVHWKIEEINYTRLAEKIYNITEKNKLKHLGGIKWLVWMKVK